MELRKLSCPICGPSMPYKVKYKANFDPQNLDFAARKESSHMHFRMCECVGCGLIYSNPVVELDYINKLYENAYYVEEKQLENMANDYLKYLMQYNRQFPSVLNILEVGCGNGFFLKKLSESTLNIQTLAGVEPGKKAYDQADSLVKKIIVNDFLKKGQFQSASFDVICSFQVFDHVPDPRGFLELVKHYLKPGGHFFQIHHNIKSPLPTILGSRATTYDVEHLHLWSHSTMKKILNKSGLTPVYIQNIKTSYYLDHVLKMLPLPEILKHASRKFASKCGLSSLKLSLYVENMSVLSVNK